MKPLIHKTCPLHVQEIKMFGKNLKNLMVYVRRRYVRLRESFTTPMCTRKIHDGVSSINLYRAASCKQRRLRRKQTDGRRMIDNRSRNAGTSHVGIRKPRGRVLSVPNGRATKIKMDTSGRTHTGHTHYVRFLVNISVCVLIFDGIYANLLTEYRSIDFYMT